MNQYYSNLFSSVPNIYQGSGEHSKEFKAFCEEYLKIIADVKDPIVPNDPKRNTCTYDIRIWEVWSVLSNAKIEPHHKLLEYGAWPTFYCVYVSHLVKEVIAIDNLQGFNRGDGVLFARLHKMFPDVWISEINKYNRPNLQVFQGNIEHTNFADKYFDRIVSYGVHEHVKDDLQGLREINRILKDDGIVSMTVDFFIHGWEYNDALQGRCYDPGTLFPLIENSGFEFVYTPDWSNYDWQKGLINTLQNPHVNSIGIILKKI